MKTRLRKRRFDYFLIWGHGLPHREAIVEHIRREPRLRILAMRRHVPRDLERFVREVYSCDYAPFEHLESKTRYLLDVPAEVEFIFVENEDVEDELCGEGAFRHVECMRIKRLKEAIRDDLNPRFQGMRSENHVVHASDNEHQTHAILQLLGFGAGIDHLRSGGHALLPHAPHHLANYRGFLLKKIPLAKLACRLLRVDRSAGGTPRHDVEAITASPHFRCLQGASQAYEDYYAQSPGVHQTDDHSVHNLRQLARDFCYLEAPHETAYIVTRYEPRSDRFIVMDGLHRAAVLASQQARDVVVAVVHDG